MRVRWKQADFLMVILFLQFISYAMVFFDVPIARQVVGFIYFTFVPGFVIIKLLKLDDLDVLETVLFSVGLSVAFLMLAGLLINEFCFLFGISRPLSLFPLMMILNSFVLIGGVLVYSRNEDINIFGLDTSGLSPLYLLLLVLPIMSIVGAIWINAYENNLVLIFMIISIALLFAIGVVSKKFLPRGFYAPAVFMIAIAILYHSSLISNYIVTAGSDVPVEYFVLKTTQNSNHWSSTTPHFWDVGYGRTNAMLSITILPTIYSNLLNMDPTWVLKILLPLIFCFVPLGLYRLWKGYIREKYAFASAFLFMAQSTFYTEMLGLNRQMIAEFFFVLLLMVISCKKMGRFGKTACFMIFSVALVTSHYALAEIFLFFIFFTVISLYVLKRPSRNITIGMVVFFFVVMFTWYIYTSGSAVFDSFVSFGDNVYRQLSDFFDPTSRGQTVMRGLGMEEPPSIWNTISRIFAYLTEALIVVGFIGLITKRIKIRFEREYFMLSLTAMGFLAALILVPGLANTLNMTRFYHILLFFLAPFCAMGALIVVRLVSRRGNKLGVSLLLLIVLIPYFLFQTGFVYELTGSESWSVPLSKHRMDALRLYGGFGYIDAYSVFGAQWLSRNVDSENSQIYADIISRANVLSIYGMIYQNSIHRLYNVTIVENDGVVYLSELNVVHERIVEGGLLWNSSELSSLFDNLNRVYTNGGSEVYKNRP